MAQSEVNYIVGTETDSIQFNINNCIDITTTEEITLSLDISDGLNILAGMKNGVVVNPETVPLCVPRAWTHSYDQVTGITSISFLVRGPCHGSLTATVGDYANLNPGPSRTFAMSVRSTEPGSTVCPSTLLVKSRPFYLVIPTVTFSSLIPKFMTNMSVSFNLPTHIYNDWTARPATSHLQVQLVMVQISHSNAYHCLGTIGCMQGPLISNGISLVLQFSRPPTSTVTMTVQGIYLTGDGPAHILLEARYCSTSYHSACFGRFNDPYPVTKHYEPLPSPTNISLATLSVEQLTTGRRTNGVLTLTIQNTVHMGDSTMIRLPKDARYIGLSCICYVTDEADTRFADISVSITTTLADDYILLRLRHINASQSHYPLGTLRLQYIIEDMYFLSNFDNVPVYIGWGSIDSTHLISADPSVIVMPQLTQASHPPKLEFRIGGSFDRRNVINANIIISPNEVEPTKTFRIDSMHIKILSSSSQQGEPSPRILGLLTSPQHKFEFVLTNSSPYYTGESAMVVDGEAAYPASQTEGVLGTIVLSIRLVLPYTQPGSTWRPFDVQFSHRGTQSPFLVQTCEWTIIQALSPPVTPYLLRGVVLRPVKEPGQPPKFEVAIRASKRLNLGDTIRIYHNMGTLPTSSEIIFGPGLNCRSVSSSTPPGSYLDCLFVNSGYDSENSFTTIIEGLPMPNRYLSPSIMLVHIFEGEPTISPNPIFETKLGFRDAVPGGNAPRYIPPIIMTWYEPLGFKPMRSRLISPAFRLPFGQQTGTNVNGTLITEDHPFSLNNSRLSSCMVCIHIIFFYIIT